MKNHGSTSERLLELAHEPLTAATRAEFEAILQELPPEEQTHWREIRAEADLLHSHLAHVPMPESFDQLLAPLSEPVRPAAPRSMTFRTRIYLYAASALLILGLVTWYAWNQEPEIKPLAALPAAMSDKLALDVVRLHESNPALDVTSADPEVVRTALKPFPMPFEPIMISPNTKIDLIGGGHTTLAGVPCLFTRWKAGGVIYTLCQFDGKALNIPEKFASTRTVATALWHDNFRYQVQFWPGPKGMCTWAVVLETDKTVEPFSTAY